jgi:hypothetical protein
LELCALAQVLAYGRVLGGRVAAWPIATGLFVGMFAVPLGLLGYTAGQSFVVPDSTCYTLGVGGWAVVGGIWGALYGAVTAIPLATRAPPGRT